MSNIGLNWVFIKRLWLVFKTMSKPPTSAFWILLLTLPASAVEQVAIYYIGLVPSGFYLALENRDIDGFYQQLWVACWWVLAIVMIKCSKCYAAGALYIQWRWNLTETLHTGYFTNKLYYDLNCLSNGIDNPDMRITQDVDKLTDTLQSIILLLVVFPGVVIYYTYKCWVTMGYIGPVCIYGYFIVACIFNKILMSPIVTEVFQLERKEGHLRYIHVNLRTSAESAAFTDAESVEHPYFRDTLKSILDSKQKIVTKQLFLNIAVNAFDYIGAILSYMILAIPIFGGMYDNVSHLGYIISQNSFVTMYLVSSFSTMVDISGKIADLAGYTHRVGELLEFIQQHKNDPAFCNEGGCERSSKSKEDHFSDFTNSVAISREDPKADSSPDLLRLINITIQNPVTNKSLVKNLYISLNHHTNVLIHGPPAAGKSSILRTIKSLWVPLVGSIESTDDIMFLPQHPYFTRQCLGTQITLPDPIKHGDENELMTILERLKLTDILDDILWVEEVEKKSSCIEGLLTKRQSEAENYSIEAATNENESETYPIISRPSFINKLLSPLSFINKPTSSRPPSTLQKTPQRSWYKVLSPGRQQLLAFARVLYHKPQLVIMDEATSAVSPDYAKLIYSLLNELGICYLSVSHDETLERFHDRIIVIAGDGVNWSWRNISRH